MVYDLISSELSNELGDLTMAHDLTSSELSNEEGGLDFKYEIFKAWPRSMECALLC